MPARPVAVSTGGPTRPPQAASGTGEPLLPVLVTEHGGRVSHIVTDDQVTAPLRGADPRALCGVVFTPAALTTPPGPICDACLLRMRPPATARPARWHLRRTEPGCSIPHAVAGRL